MSQNQLIEELGLVRWYPHTEGTGATLNDYTGTTNGTITNALWRKGPNGQYMLDYDGDGDYVTCGDLSALGDRTLSLWVWLDTLKDFGWIAYDSPNYGMAMISYADAHIGFFFGNGSLNNIDIAGFSTGQWYHLVTTFNDSTNLASVYVDGVFQSSDTFGTDSVIDSGIYYLGLNTTNALNGKITNVMIANRIWTEEEVAMVYKKTFIQ